MFSTPITVGEANNYDFECEENAIKWRGVFINSLKKVFVLLVISYISF